VGNALADHWPESYVGIKEQVNELGHRRL
jgi:hypothetical protein